MGRAGPMVALNTYQDNLCLWRCIAVHRGARPDRSTTAARELAKSFFKLKAAPNDIPKTSLDEFDKVERHLNQGAPFSDWFGNYVSMSLSALRVNWYGILGVTHRPN